ncbi:MAG: hypothetical protein M1830_001740 [Pleopsidium flavum]|nr:MAG: hypothetical protein M1830_001740 [Pleopsidium flavum]
MLKQLRYGTFIFFGLLTFGGVLFIWLVVPETKRLTLEEMDILFGSMGLAQADSQRMAEISKEIGLDDVLRGVGLGGGFSRDEKSSDQIHTVVKHE